MIKRVTLLKRKPGLSLEEFREQYEDVHVPLALKLLPTMKRMVRNYVIHTSNEEPEFDCITHTWFDDMEGFQTMIDTMTGTSVGHASQALGHSVAVFMDTTKTAYVLVEEVESEMD